MNKEMWKDVDAFINSRLMKNDGAKESILEASEQAGLRSINVAPSQGKMLYLLAKLKGVKSILEIGTLGGYSTVWLAEALPENGQLITLEYSEKNAAVARENIRKAGLEDKVEVLVGPALETLPTLKSKGYDHFDFIFIDADKRNNSNYLKWALELSKSATAIVVDNVVRKGRVLDTTSEDENIQGVRDFVDLLSEEDRVDATAIQTVGEKGYDGFVLAVVK